MPRQPGGGIYGYGVQGTVATLLGSAVVNNTASSGDGGILGILNSGSLSITNSTISANSARSGGGIAALTGAITTLKATFLAGNAAISGPNCASTVTSLGENLIGEADGCSPWMGASAAGLLVLVAQVLQQRQAAAAAKWWKSHVHYSIA